MRAFLLTIISSSGSQKHLSYLKLFFSIAKRVRTKNRMQIIIPPTRLIQHRLILRELEGIQAKFSFKKCVLRTPAVLETVLGKSSAIFRFVCLSLV